MLSRASTPLVDRVSAATIFVVEDDPDMSRHAREGPRGSGYASSSPRPGDDAPLSSPMPADLIILDLMLPDADGLSLTTSFRKLTDAPNYYLRVRDRGSSTGSWLEAQCGRLRAKTLELEGARGAASSRPAPVAGAS